MEDPSFRFSLRTAFLAIFFTATIILLNLSFEPLFAFCIDVVALAALVAVGLYSYSKSSESAKANETFQDLANFFVLVPLILIAMLVVYMVMK